MEDLTIWRYHQSAICILEFYKQLLKWCDAQDAIRPPDLPPVADGQYPSRLDTVSNVPLPLDSMDQETVPKDDAAGVSRMPTVKKRNNTSSAEGSGSSKRSCMIKDAAATSAHTPPAATVKPSKVQNARKRHTSSTRSSANSKRSCLGNGTASTIAHTTAVVNVPSVGSGELKPPPDMGWQKQASATPFMDRSSAPEPINYAECSEILPHLLDKDTGDGHCSFRALSFDF